jgi:IS5 family transposase
VCLAGLLDFKPLERACAAYQAEPGRRGHPVVHQVRRLLRALLVKYWYDLSLRQLEERLRCDMLFRWFVGYGLHEATPDHTTLHRFEVYLYREHPRLFFDTVLTQIDASGDDGHDQVQIGDTFALRANAALESLIQRLRHASYNLLTTLAKREPEEYAALQPQLDEAALFGFKQEKRDFLLSREEWYARLLLTVQAVSHCLALLPPAASLTPEVARCLAQLHKIMADELAISRDEAGRPLAVSLLPEKKRGQLRICGATHPEATIRNHGPNKRDFGYNISLATTLDFVREIRADTGSTGDVIPIPALLTAQEEHHDCLPAKLIYDQIAGTGKTAHEVAVASAGQTQLVAKPVPPKEKDTFGPETFTRSADGHSLTCPDGRLITRHYRSGSGDGWIFRALPPQCRGCSRLLPCRGSDQPPTTKRDIFISDYRPDYDRLVAYSQSADFKQDMKLRPQVERVIAGLVLHNGARYARFRGLVKVDFQVKMAAMVYNAKHWLVLLAEREGRRKRPVRRRWGLPTPSRSLP